MQTVAERMAYARKRVLRLTDDMERIKAAACYSSSRERSDRLVHLFNNAKAARKRWLKEFPCLGGTDAT